MSGAGRAALAPLGLCLSLACSAPAGRPQAAPATPDTARGGPGTGEPAATGEATGVRADDEQREGISTSRFMSVLPIEVGPGARQAAQTSTDDRAFATALRATVRVRADVDDLGEVTRRSGVTADAGRIALPSLAVLAKSDDPVTPDHLASTFVVDHGEPPVAALGAQLRGERASSDAVEPSEVTAFVARFITNKTYGRGFDFASRVAKTRAGDCTEHAVLTAALMRHVGIPARVVLGIALIAVSGPDLPTTVLAVGHAWVEYHAEDGWQVADAALTTPESTPSPTADSLPADVTLRRVYLPIAVMRDEGPGYGRQWLDGTGLQRVLAVVLE